MPAQRFRQAILPAEEVDCACLAAILREDSTAAAFGGTKLVPGNSGFIHDFFPPELIGVPLGQRSAGVRVFHDWQLEWQRFCVGEEAVWRKNRHNYRHQMDTAREQNN